MKRTVLLRYRYRQSRPYSSKDDSYLIRRLQDLEEHNTVRADDPLAKLSQPISIVDENPKMNELYNSLGQKKFEGSYQNQIQYAKLKKNVDKQSKDISLSKPWSGEEDVGDTSLRMIIDSVGKPLKRSDAIQGNLGFTGVKGPANEPRAVRASRKIRDKLEHAQDSIINYRRDREQNFDESEQSEFRALYAEKFTPIGSLEKLRSLADQRIEESRKQGSFDGISNLRGKPLQMPHLNQHIDRTEHYLNNMLVRQKITPPWIESQGQVNSGVEGFRKEARSAFEHDVSSYLKEVGILRPGADLDSVRISIEEKFGSEEKLVQQRLLAWRKSRSASFKVKIDSLNSNLRSYNLQAPLSAQKLYLLLDREFTKVRQSFNLEKLVTFELDHQAKDANNSTVNETRRSSFALRRIFGL